MERKRISVLEAAEKEIIQYINGGYANWEIERKLQEKANFKDILIWDIRKIKSAYRKTLTDEQKQEIEKKSRKRRNEYRHEAEIKKLKEGCTIEELTNNLTNANRAIAIKAIKDRIERYVELGIITKEEIQLAREKREKEKNKAEASNFLEKGGK